MLRLLGVVSEVYSEPNRTSEMELFAKIATTKSR